MAYEVDTAAPCADCGQLTRRRHAKTNIPLCFDCAEQRMVSAMVNMRAKTGPQYTNWVASMRRVADNLTLPDESGGSTHPTSTVD